MTSNQLVTESISRVADRVPAAVLCAAFLAFFLAYLPGSQATAPVDDDVSWTSEIRS